MAMKRTIFSWRDKIKMNVNHGLMEDDDDDKEFCYFSHSLTVDRFIFCLGSSQTINLDFAHQSLLL